ncbi:MAG: SIS domain-containing protein [Armatimonadetes bacterium]|nr:SIS domain-containing protein [Armatimonadota bacterium]
MDWRSRAEHFLEHEKQFHLGMLPTEQPHPKTRGLAELLQRDTAAGVRMLLAVDRDVEEMAGRIFDGGEFAQLVETLADTLRAGGRICFSGCGATGRLSILLEAGWRHFQQAADPPQEQRADQVISIMTGGDFALVKSVENFEDYMSFGRQQVREAGLGEGDVLVAISEGGETSSVIGTIWEAHERGARTFFVFNNPAEVLAAHIERSREVIQSPAVVTLELHSGPMALAGSTRMQATTAELLVVGAALELALAEVHMPDAGLSAQQYVRDFSGLLDDLTEAAAVQAMTDWVRFEHELYRNKGLVTYFADECLLDIFTDTTERSPTFMLPPFRKCDDTVSPPSWAFVKNPMRPTPDAWRRVLGREPRCLDWDRALYVELGAPEHVQKNPPLLDAGEIHKFLIGNEDDPSRYAPAANAAVLAALAEELASPDLPAAFASASGAFAQRAAVIIGEGALPEGDIEPIFHIPCTIPATPLRLFSRLAVKLAFNTVSTATMGCMGRMVSNWMAHVETTNKKLIDRGTRLIAELAGVDYETACYALHETIAEMNRSPRDGRERVSPVAAAINRLRGDT